MNGKEFLEVLKAKYNAEDKVIYGKYAFNQWDNDNRFCFLDGSERVYKISQLVIVKAWEANCKIDDWWLKANGFPSFHNTCRLHVLKYLIAQERDEQPFKSRRVK